MRNTLRLLLVTGLAVAGAALALPAVTASAASTAPGYDVSYPQCSTTLPTGQAFGVVGVNGGLATKANPCLAAQLSWATRSSGAAAAQPKAQLYLNTANPGQVRSQVTTWPTSGSTPYGACDGSNSNACSWLYGYQRAQNSVTAYFAPAAASAGVDSTPGHYTWWLDVETSNTWQTGSSTAPARNRASLEGMTSYLASRGAKVGLYSTASQWQAIAGTPSTGSSLHALNSWLAGASTLSGATANCAKPPLVSGGAVLLTQWVSGGLDHDVSCR
jgi:hypothetical protein